MAEFTTEERRRLTSTDPTSLDKSQEEVLDARIDNSLALKVKEDETNNSVFRITNSELTGLAFEYRYLTGYYHPTLDETEYFYNETEEGDYTPTLKSYWDSQKLQDAGSLIPGNEFHLNVREGTTVKYPIRPEKYASWVLDTHEYVSPFETTEAKLIAMIRTLDTWNTSGGGSGTFESTIFGDYKELILGEDDDNQNYMTVGYVGYQSDPNNGYMTQGFEETGEIILINGSDSENFSFGVVVGSKDLPSRILFSSYGKIGEIPEDSSITSTFTAGQSINNSIAETIVFSLKNYYTMIKHYLDNNPNKDDTDNQPVMDSIVNVLALIETWEEVASRDDFSVMIQLMDDIELERTATIISNRISYITPHLNGLSALYTKRFEIIDVRLSKNMGSLKEMMIIARNTETVFSIIQDKKDSKILYSSYFISKQSLRDGDYFMRIFVDDVDGLSIGEECYILTNNPEVKEIKATIDDIVDTVIDDTSKPVSYDSVGNLIFADYPCKKVFFNDEIFGKEYLKADYFRIVKEI